MKITNKAMLQQISLSHSSDIDSKDFTNLPYSFLVIETILASNNPLRFRGNLLERTKNLS